MIMSLNIEVKENQNQATYVLTGKLDTTTAPNLDAAIEEKIANLKEIVFDCKDLEYVSSAGLRVILKTQKTMNQQGSMKLTNVSDTIMEIFDITGFVDFLNIE
jgi:anti-sigma B factor antagonist